MIPWIEMNNAVNRKLLESNFYRNLFPNCQLATIISPLFFFLLYIYIYKPVNTKKKFYRILYAKEKRKRNLLDHMDSNQMRPVTPQPPQGGSSGFPAILSLLILHRHLRHDIIYQSITLNQGRLAGNYCVLPEYYKCILIFNVKAITQYIS